MGRHNGSASLIAGALAALGASACCVVPLVLLTLGIGGSWVASLTAVAPVRPVFVGLTLLFLGLAFRRLYLTPLGTCASGTTCAEPRVLKRRRLTFWMVAVSLLGLLAVPSLAPLFY
ncbi:mercuric transporter MerT family protein [Burkholderia contaminans]|uniref:mercuric transporter MerT family protein n=1 Tax=Burkholderia contaminans TaxID=488447 RepID=UPI001F134824|nr:mercuric transporter MerT family protein [Burkholderia contaminans]UMY33492.1 mercuric transporter MerT family protein [Burkholderia contaminans]